MRTPLRSAAAVVAAAAAVAGAALTLPSGGGRAAPDVPSRTEEAARWSGLMGGERAHVDVGQRVLVVLSAFSLADRVRRAGGVATDFDERRWTAAAFAAQQQLITNLGRRGVRIRPEYRYTRTINGFSALLDAPAIALLERTTGVSGVYPIRVAYPASVVTRALSMRSIDPRPPVMLGGYTGRGVTIALLDTGVDLRKPYLHGHVLDGVDVVGNGADARARARPDDPTALEVHGTQMAGILVGSGGPAGLRGIVPAAFVFPIRVGGWQRDVSGGYAVYARSDQVLAGLERAVDPNGDGDAHDAARIALVSLVEPFAAFTDAPLARAAKAALDLDTLVIAAAGNDGPAGPAFGSVSGPAGAPAALAVGAFDSGRRLTAVRVVVRAELRILLDRVIPLANAVPPTRTLELAPAVPAAAGADAADYFDSAGLSTVAGRAALVPAGADPAAAVRFASRAGAAAVLVHGQDLPPGSLGLDEGVGVPAVALPAGAARELRSALRRGEDVEVVIAAPRASTARRPSVAPFSSWGLSFDGRVKPELVAPGVAIPTAVPGRSDDGSGAFGTVNGSSAAAAVGAGAAALLAQARPSLRAGELAGVLVGAARPLRSVPLPAQGAGVLDLGRAAAVEVTALPATLAFGRGHGDGWQGREQLVLRNVSSRRVTVFVGTGQGARPAVVIGVVPRRLELAPGHAARVTVRARIARYPHGRAASGALTMTVLGGATTRVPWALVLSREGGENLLGPLQLSAARFTPSDRRPAVVAVRAGGVLRSPRGNEVRPVLRLDLDLWTGRGKRLGLLARLRDVLPGRYAFGLTGRGPDGEELARGRYRLTLVAWPTGGGPPSSRSVRFEIK